MAVLSALWWLPQTAVFGKGWNIPLNLPAWLSRPSPKTSWQHLFHLQAAQSQAPICRQPGALSLYGSGVGLWI